MCPMKDSSGLRKAPPVTTRSTPGLSTRVVITGSEFVMTVRFRRVVRFFATSSAVEPRAEEDGLAIVNQLRRLLPDSALLVGLHVAALGKRGLRLRVVDANATADLLEAVLLEKHQDIAPDGRLAGVEVPAQPADLGAAVAQQILPDRGPSPLVGHRHRQSLRNRRILCKRRGFLRAVNREIDYTIRKLIETIYF